jgi:cytoplasmic iron level regulating protein YaaA (DUF328/UPF0246 family)
MNVGLVSCCKEKLPCATRALWLYTNRRFWLATQYAENYCDAWVILSGKHGIVNPEDIIEPYDFDLRKQKKAYIKKWATRVNRGLKKKFPGAFFMVMASGPYLEAVKDLPHEIKEYASLPK